MQHNVLNISELSSAVTRKDKRFPFCAWKSHQEGLLPREQCHPQKWVSQHALQRKTLLPTGHYCEQLWNFRPLRADQPCRNSLPQHSCIPFIRTVAKNLRRTGDHRGPRETWGARSSIGISVCKHLTSAHNFCARKHKIHAKFALIVTPILATISFFFLNAATPTGIFSF